jgi:hypothetical protein
MTHGPQFITALIDDPDLWNEWDVEETGLPGIALFANALQVWAMAQNRVEVTVQEAALAFNTTEAVIRQAVEWHAWMFLNGDFIDHDGE